MIPTILTLAARHWRVLLPSLAALALLGWQAIILANVKRDLKFARMELTACQDREKAAIAVARAVNAEATAQAFEAARIAAHASKAAHDRAESVRKGIDHAQDGDVADAIRIVLDGLRGQ